MQLHNMADEDDDIWKRKLLTLESRVKLIELENKRIVNRIYHVRKYLKRGRRERSFLVKKCAEFGIDYEKAQPLYSASILADINAANHEDNRSQFKKSRSLTKKGRGRAQHKQDRERDPDAPKKPANAFFMFCQQQRNSMQDDQKDITVGHHELTKHLAKEWNTLGEEGKKVYYKMYEKDKARYEKEMRQYSKEKPPKETTKVLKTKKQKSKKLPAKTAHDPSKSPGGKSNSLVEISPSGQNTMTSSPPGFGLLNNLPFGNLPSPMLEMGEDDVDDSFNNFDYHTV